MVEGVSTVLEHQPKMDIETVNVENLISESSMIDDGSTPEKRKKFSCALCSYRCYRGWHLKTHMRIHTGEKPYSCGFCSFITAEVGNLRRHLMTHTDEKPFACDKCPYKCRSFSSLKQHLLIHEGIKPYSCTVCGYICRLSAHLKKHMMIHTGEKPYPCPFCDYTSRQSGVLKRHVMTHTGEKPYICPICSHRCRQPAHLKQHMMKVHSKNKSDSSPDQIVMDSSENEPEENEWQIEDISTLAGATESGGESETALVIDEFEPDLVKTEELVGKKCKTVLEENSDVAQGNTEGQWQQLKESLPKPRKRLHCQFCLFTCLGQVQLKTHFKSHAKENDRISKNHIMKGLSNKTSSSAQTDFTTVTDGDLKKHPSNHSTDVGIDLTENERKMLYVQLSRTSEIRVKPRTCLENSPQNSCPDRMNSVVKQLVDGPPNHVPINENGPNCDSLTNIQKVNGRIPENNIRTESSVSDEPLETIQSSKKRKLEALEIDSSSNVVEVIKKLDSISEQIDKFTSQNSKKEDTFDQFGKCIASILREMPRSKALQLQQELFIVAMNSSFKNSMASRTATN